MSKFLLTVGFAMLIISTVAAQGVTTGSIAGKVTDANGESLPGANVVAVHEPSGTTYGTTSLSGGRFSIPNVRVGGPYRITITFIGYSEYSADGLQVALGSTTNVNAKLTEASTSLEEITISAERESIFSPDKTGAETFIGKERVQTLPTITRGFNDFTRLTPQADIKGSSISIGGMNNRFNQVTIDGAVSNDVFGLSDSGTNGGQTETSPISLDAIEAFQVQIAPYDVRLGGFAGGGISAITRSGTNEFSGSVYHFFRNESLAGVTPTNEEGVERTKFNKFTDRQSGFRIGGPIMKDKLFFFLNGEVTKTITPLSFQPGTPTSEITADEASRIAARAIELGYDPGSYAAQESTNESTKLFGRLDWNISNVHKLTLRHSFTKGEKIDLARNPRRLTFSNGAILRESTTNSTVLELNSRFSNRLANNLVIGYTTVREPRSAPGEPFPAVTIRLDAQRSVILGTEAFSTVNQLDQDILTLTDNLTYFLGRHTVTVGTHNEYYDIYNAFIGQAYGDYQFSASPPSDLNPATAPDLRPYTAIENWERGLANNFTYQYSKTSNPREGADFRAIQVGLYAQDEYQMTDNLKITGGIRLDIPFYLDDPMRNDDFNNSVVAKQYDVMTNRMPKPAFMWSPRVGFNWDVTGESTTQIRGGTGIFTSRFPFVWAGGAFTQSGILLDRNNIAIAEGNAPTIEFNPDINDQPRRASASGPGGNITVIDENFKLPQVARTNIGIDQQLPWFGLVGSFDFMYSKNLNSFRFTNINLVQPTETLGGADNRVLYPASGTRRLPNYTEIIYINNVNAGSAYSFTFQLQKPLTSGFSGSIAYTYTRSKDLFPGTSSQNQSNYYRVASVDGSNNVQVGTAPYDSRSRIVGYISYKKEYLKHLATTVTLVYTGQSGVPFSYIVTGDLNRSTFTSSNSNHYSLMYIPRNASEIQFVEDDGRTPEQQWEEFNSFIESQEYLRERRGEYAERNAARTPFTSQFDLKIVQDIFTNIGKNRNTLQLTFDIFNFANLLNKDWGWRYTYGQSFFDNTFSVLELRGYTAENVPLYTFNPVRNNEPWTVSDSPIGGSRWVGQIGVRYIFN